MEKYVVKLCPTCPYLLYVEMIRPHVEQDATHYCCVKCNGALETSAKYPREKRAYPKKGDTHETSVIPFM